MFYYFINKYSLKLSTATTNKKDANDVMSQQMESMNKTMPIMMVFMCFITPVGLGIYWVVSAGYRSVQQVTINKIIANMNLDDIIEKNKENISYKQAQYMGMHSMDILMRGVLTPNGMQLMKSESEKLKKINSIFKV